MLCLLLVVTRTRLIAFPLWRLLVFVCLWGKLRNISMNVFSVVGLFHMLFKFVIYSVIYCKHFLLQTFCSRVPQPTTLPRAPIVSTLTYMNYRVYICLCNYSKWRLLYPSRIIHSLCFSYSDFCSYSVSILKMSTFRIVKNNCKTYGLHPNLNNCFLQ
jgi:hypothetical protein